MNHHYFGCEQCGGAPFAETYTGYGVWWMPQALDALLEKHFAVGHTIMVRSEYTGVERWRGHLFVWDEQVRAGVKGDGNA